MNTLSVQLAFTVHRDLNSMLLDHIRPVATGELAALIGVENLGAAVSFDRLLEHPNEKSGVLRVRQPKDRHLARVSVVEVNTIVTPIRV
jgi:hypothetical protein